MDYLLLFLAILIIPLIAQIYVSTTYNKYKEIKLQGRMSGFEIARKILDDNGLEKLYIVETKGHLTDHYDSKQKVVRLSSAVYHGDTISAAGIAAHECGHAIQDKEGYFFMKFRSFIFPLVKVATTFSYIIILAGVVMELMNLLLVGIALVSLGLFFQIVTLPVEFNASRIAKTKLLKLKITNSEENSGSAKVLNAAAMTYVAGVLASALEIIRLALIYFDRR